MTGKSQTAPSSLGIRLLREFPTWACMGTRLLTHNTTPSILVLTHTHTMCRVPDIPTLQILLRNMTTWICQTSSGIVSSHQHNSDN